MSFTDDDLRRWKEREHNTPTFKALLARLEVSESLNEYANHTHYCEVVQEEPTGNCSCGFDRKQDKWRKAAGK